MKKEIWVDFENAPHIPVLLPVIRGLESHGFKFFMTARHFSFTVQLVEEHNLPAIIVGKGGGAKSSVAKALFLFVRVLKLLKIVWPKRNSILFALSHSSRAQLFAAWLLGLESISLEDYEHSNQLQNKLSTYLLVPESIPLSSFPKNKKGIIHYPGIKENIYLGGLSMPVKPPQFIDSDSERVYLLFRPEGRTTHYRSAISTAIQEKLLLELSNTKNLHMLVYPRDPIQQKEIESILKNGTVTYSFPPITNGIELIASVDLVIGGGGTMTREASVLGVPSYSFFAGKWGGVDRYLEEKGILFAIRTEADIHKIKVEKKKKNVQIIDNATCEFIVNFILNRKLYD